MCVRKAVISQSCVIAVIVILMLTSGCASVFSPYETNFQCPETDNGKCVSVSDAHKESIEAKEKNGLLKVKGSNLPDNGKESTPPSTRKYEQAIYEKLSALIKEPKAPMVVPPEVMRIMILPYKGQKNELYMTRFLYIFLNDPKWLLLKEE